jgi:pyrroloquinoline-quinone synthase
MSQSVIDAIHDAIAARRLLDHPFYAAWSKGALSRDDLRTYATQYYQWVLAFPTWISATHANATDLSLRQALLENLIDEERGPENHPELWLRFCDALGIDRAAVTSAAPLPETTAAIDAMRRVCRDEPAVAGVAALYAYESQQPEVMKTKRAGLRDLYDVPSGHEYFEVHETADVVHSAEERRLLVRHGAGHEPGMLAAARTALEATYRILDGVEKRRA